MTFRFNSRSLHEPAWSSRLPGVGGPGDNLRGWLIDQGSLTRLMINHCAQQAFHVEVVSQRWFEPLHSEQAMLSMRDGEYGLIRQVRLMCGDDYRVFARTIIPIGSFTGKARHLSMLKSRPLGAVLFADPKTRRICMQYARLQQGHKLYQDALRHDAQKSGAAIWARRTLFEYANQPLLVNEIFMPVMENIRL